MDLNFAAFVGAFIVFMAAALLISKKRRNPEYDERQLLERGRAYESGFIVSMVLAIVFAVAMVANPDLGRYAMALLMAVAFGGGTVVIVRCIWTDAYFSTGTNTKSYLLITALAACANLAVVFVNAPWGTPAELLASELVINLIVGIEFVAAFATFLVKAAAEKHEEA